MESSTTVTTLARKGPWIASLDVRVLLKNQDTDYHSKKPQSRKLVPSDLCQGTGPRGRVPWKRQRQGITTREEPYDTEKGTEEPDFTAAFDSHSNNDNDQDCGTAIYDLYLFETCNDEILQVDRIHMMRESNEPMERSLKRLEISLSKKLQGPKESRKSKRTKKKKAKGETASTIWRRPYQSESRHQQEADLFSGFVPWDVSGRNNLEVWSQLDPTTRQYPQVAISVSLESDGSAVVIPIEVQVCPPTIVSVHTFEQFEANVFVGVPIVVETKVWFATRAVVDWYVNQELVLKDSPCFTPTRAFVGKMVSVLITPIRSNHDGSGCQEAYCFQKPVESLPLMPIVSSLRGEWTKTRDANDLRVVSYNILADQNAYPRDTSSVTNLYPWCDFKFLDRKRRMPMILHELLSYHADVICLQEVDMLVYDTLLRPVLECQNYQGYFSVKRTGSTREGCAMFWSLDCFETVGQEEQKTLVIRDLFPTTTSPDAWESINAIAQLLELHNNLHHVIKTKLGHILQVTNLTLRSDHQQQVTLANTHLFFHPLAGHIRVMQLLVSCHYLEQQLPFVFCGDFNATADSGANTLMFQRSVPSDHNNGHTWEHLQDFTWEKETRNVVKTNSDCTPYIPTLFLPPSFPKICSGYGPKVPDFTHYILGFVGTLDYILASEPSATCQSGFEPRRWAPMPSKEFITQHVAIPNEKMPSDHISLVCDLGFKTHDSVEQADKQKHGPF